MVYDIPVKYAGGAVFVRFRNLQIVHSDDYFAVMDAVRPLLERDDFKGCTVGFYINIITLPQGHTLRLNYLSVDVPETIRVIEQFVNDGGTLEIVQVEHPNRSKPIDEYDDGADRIELDFKTFLDAYTRICLEMIASYGRDETRQLVGAYFLNDYVRGIRPERVIQDAFLQHSTVLPI